MARRPGVGEVPLRFLVGLHAALAAARAAGPRRLVLPFLVVLTLGTSVWRLGEKNVWLDEAWSWNQAALPARSLVASTAADDVHPPLYYLLLKAWTVVSGESPSGLRGLSVLASLLAMALAFRFGSSYLQPGALAAALGWLAVSPLWLFYAQEARMYALTTAAVLGACVAYREWVESGFARTGALAAFAISGVVAIYLHYFAALVLAAVWAHFLTLAVHRARVPGGAAAVRRPVLAWAGANGAIAAAYLPWAPEAAAQIARGQAWRHAVAPAAVPGYAKQLVHDWFLGYYGMLPGGSPLAAVAAAAVTVIAASGLAGLVVLLCGRQRHERDAFLAVVCTLPPLVGLAALPKTGHMELSRYLSFLLPLLLIAIARGFSALRLGRRFAAAALSLGAVAAVPSTAAYFADPVRDSDLRPIVKYLGEHVGGAGGAQRAAVLVAPGYMVFPARYASRNLGLAFRRVEENAGFWRAVGDAAPAAPPGGVWVIVERRWPEFERLAREPRLREVEVPGGHPECVRLFRVQANREAAPQARLAAQGARAPASLLAARPAASTSRRRACRS